MLLITIGRPNQTETFSDSYFNIIFVYILLIIMLLFLMGLIYNLRSFNGLLCT